MEGLERRLQAAEAIAEKQLRQAGVALELLERLDYRMHIGPNGFPMWRRHNPVGPSISPDVQLAAMLWACCRYIRQGVDDPEKACVAGGTLGLLFASLRVPEAAERILRDWRAHNARKAAVAKHSKPGGSYDLKRKARELWATGRFKSRDRCAETFAFDEDISYRTAREYLKGAPDPDPWPAKNT